MLHRSLLVLFLVVSASWGATFGTVVSVLGGATDLVLDEGRSRLYLVNTNQNRIEVYSTTQRRLLTPITTDSAPLAAAISRSGQFLYVTSYNAGLLDVIDLTAQTVVSRIALPAKPEGIAIGLDDRVLISTIGSGTGNLQNVLLLFDPSSTDPNTALKPVTVTPAPPIAPQLPAPSGKQFQATRSSLMASGDGKFIAGVNIVNAATRAVFLYEVSSGSVLRSRIVAGISGVIGIAKDGSKFMSGAALFDAATLQVLAQENAANSPYPIATANFNLENIHGGSVFRPDGTALYNGFDISPQTAGSANNTSQLMLNDPDNLLIQTGLQIPENLSGKMIITSDGNTIYALSESGFVTIPISTLSQSPVAVPDKTVIVLANDQCGVTASLKTVRVTVNNTGAGRLTVSAQSTVSTQAPQVRATGTSLDFTFNTAVTALGTAPPGFDFILASPEAVNIPARVRVYQNARNAESAGTILPLPLGISATEGLQDLVYDSTRQRVYITNSGLNRVEVFDIKSNAFLAPIKVGQLPHYMALMPDGNTLYVANTGGESISIVDPDKMQSIGRVRFPPTPLSTVSAIATPGEIAAGQRGPLFMMNTTAINGTTSGAIWQINIDQAAPRPASTVIGSTNGTPRAIPGPHTMVASAGGEVILLGGTDGLTYLYDATADDFVQARQLATQVTAVGYFGPATVGPRGQYFVINGQVLNSALTPTSARTAGTRPVAAVSAISATQYAQFSMPVRANANTAVADAGLVEIVDATSGSTVRSVQSLEGVATQVLTGARPSAVNYRTLAVDSAAANAYELTISGLSIVSLAAPGPASQNPAVNTKGVVNAASYQTAIAQNGLISIFGRNLGTTESAGSTPLPTVMGGSCVTLNNTALPLILVSAGQINAQVPPELAAGTYSLVVRSAGKNAASAAQPVVVAKYAPAVLMDPATNQVILVHADGSFVNKDNPGHRDEPLTMYALGLGLTTGGKISGGNASPSSPLAETATLQVFFGDPAWVQAEMIVDFSGLTPGYVGLYQINLRIPGFHVKGDAVPITLKVGGVSSPSTGPLVPVIPIE